MSLNILRDIRKARYLHTGEHMMTRKQLRTECHRDSAVRPRAPVRARKPKLTIGMIWDRLWRWL